MADRVCQVLHQGPGGGGDLHEGRGDTIKTYLNKLEYKQKGTISQAIIPRLEAAEYVYRYSWFITRYNDKYAQTWNTSHASTDGWYLDKVNALFVEGSTELSSVGNLYDQL